MPVYQVTVNKRQDHKRSASGVRHERSGGHQLVLEPGQRLRRQEEDCRCLHAHLRNRHERPQRPDNRMVGLREGGVKEKTKLSIFKQSKKKCRIKPTNYC